MSRQIKSSLHFYLKLTQQLKRSQKDMSLRPLKQIHCSIENRRCEEITLKRIHHDLLRNESCRQLTIVQLPGIRRTINGATHPQ